MQYIGTAGEFLEMTTLTQANASLLKQRVESALTLIWFESENNQLTIDGVNLKFHTHQLICLTEFHQVEIEMIHQAKMIRFNRDFYCIIDHDSEVSCKGVLFFGASQLPCFSIPYDELDTFQTVFKLFQAELESKEEMQQEMLQMMLKRFLILCTRAYKKQHQLADMGINQINIIREFNFLVEKYFKTKHTVAEYADLLHKSPKTLSNIFKKLSEKPPLQYIHDRKMLEARRLLRYTDHSIKEIAYELGFDDIQAFSRFFKKQEGTAPSEYREK